MFKALSVFLAAVMLLPATAVVGNDPPGVEIVAPYYIVVDADDPRLDVAEHQPQLGLVRAVGTLDDGQVTVTQRYTRLRDIGDVLPERGGVP